jgi:hypothetical protein
VVGPFHSGKSTLLNQLLGRATGFEAGQTVDPTTKGIWLWGSPLLHQNTQTPSSHSDELHAFLLLDTEGLAAPGNTADYDAKIFAISTLISNHLLYNSVRIIDESAMEYLEILARRARLFQANATHSHNPDSRTRLNHTSVQEFPTLTWVVQDFTQKTANQETPNQWLERLLQQQSASKTGEF